MIIEVSAIILTLIVGYKLMLVGVTKVLELVSDWLYNKKQMLGKDLLKTILTVSAIWITGLLLAKYYPLAGIIIIGIALIYTYLKRV